MRLIERTLNRQADVLEYVKKFIENNMQSTLEELEDDLPDYVWDVEDNLSAEDFDIRAMLDDTLLDMEVLAEFIEDIMDFESELYAHLDANPDVLAEIREKGTMGDETAEKLKDAIVTVKTAFLKTR